jgi:hypothetical protein
MAAVTTVTELNGLFKRIYADKLMDLIPDNAKLIKRVSFSQRKRLGDTYEQPVVLANEHGVTYAAAGAGAFTLNAPIAMTTQNARVPSVQMVLRSRMDYEAASKASAGGERAFRQATELMVMSMTNSVTHRLECSMLYGGSGLGQISSTANASATQTVATISDLTWAVGIWAGCENAKVEIYETSGQVGTSSFTINSVDPVNKTLTLTGSADDITILDADANGTGVGLDIFWEGSFSADMNGIDKIITNTGSLFGINAGTYNLWKGNTYAVSGAITVSHLLKSTTIAIGKGGLNEEVCCYISPTNFAVLNAEIYGKQQYDFSYKSKMGNAGNENLKLFAQSGLMEIEPHSMVKDGEAFVGPVPSIKRIGSTDVTFNNPGVGDKFFREMTDAAGFELRNYSDQAIFINEPAKWTKLTGITV